MLDISKCDAMLKEWTLWMKKVISFSVVESKSRAAIRDLLGKRDDSKKCFLNDEGTCMYMHVYYFVL